MKLLDQFILVAMFAVASVAMGLCFFVFWMIVNDHPCIYT